MPDGRDRRVRRVDGETGRLMLPETVLIVGAGLAGARCAETLRARGFQGRVLLTGREPFEPYERPALSKELLTGERRLGSLALRPQGFWASQGIELMVGAKVERVDIDAHEALLANGSVLAWDALVLATGARPRQLAVTPLRGVHVLRTVADALALRRGLQRGSRLAAVGAGFIGAEVASSASELGVEVVMVDPAPLPFARLFGPAVGEILRDRYRAGGVDLRLGAGVAGFRAGAEGEVEALELDDGLAVRCDAVLVAIGVEPAGELLSGGPGGVATDASGRTAIPAVYACGDVAAAWRPALGAHRRVEHWTSAAYQGSAVAGAILGEPDQTADEPSYFWSDQFGLRLQYVGHGAGYARVEIEGSGDSFRADYLSADGTLVAALVANRPRDIGALRRELAA